MSEESKYCTRCESYHPSDQTCLMSRSGSSFAATAPGSALAWTHTKPNIGGLYLLRAGPMMTPTMHHLVRNSESDKMNILDTDSSYMFDDVEDLHDDYEWYGPIPWE